MAQLSPASNADDESALAPPAEARCNGSAHELPRSQARAPAPTPLATETATAAASADLRPQPPAAAERPVIDSYHTGANDPRVDPYSSRKMVARLQAATSSTQPILLRTSKTTGHGHANPLTEEIDENVNVYSFLFHQLDVRFRSK